MGNYMNFTFVMNLNLNSSREWHTFNNFMKIFELKGIFAYILHMGNIFRNNLNIKCKHSRGKH